MYVYIISNEAFPGWLKVGKTNSIHKRLETFRTGAPTEYIVEFLMDGLRYDHEVHVLLTKQGIERKREWFKCDLATARAAVLEAKAEQDRLDAMVEMNRMQAAKDGWIVGSKPEKYAK
jgi:predicted GIY-YIG superfamily endonuclease